MAIGKLLHQGMFILNLSCLIDVNVTGIRYLMDQRLRKTLLAQVKRPQPGPPSVPDSSQLAYIFSHYSEW